MRFLRDCRFVKTDQGHTLKGNGWLLGNYRRWQSIVGNASAATQVRLAVAGAKTVFSLEFLIIEKHHLPRQAWDKRKGSLKRNDRVARRDTIAPPCRNRCENDGKMTFLYRNDDFYQDRLGTKIGKTQKGTPFMQEVITIRSPRRRSI